jgi:hypothetical protein
VQPKTAAGISKTPLRAGQHQSIYCLISGGS